MLLLALMLVAAPPARAVRGRVALTLSGGVSLGAYEAGLTWALVRYLRTADSSTDLAAVTGASAGGINALMAAAMWCEDRGPTRNDQPDTNVFHELWAPVGLEDLLPDEPSAFADGDGLLSAAPLERALQRLRTQVFAGAIRFRPGCSVAVGLTVTRDPPEQRIVAGLRSQRQRFVIPLRLEIDGDGAPRLVSTALGAERESTDAQLLLAEPRGERGIGILQTSQAALASGAFPFAFRPRQLCDCALRCPQEQLVTDGVCEGPDRGAAISGLSCEAVPPAGSRQLCRRAYLDGGIFDNAPIGLTVDLAESSAAGLALPFAPTVYLFVDPDHRRLSPMQSQAPGSALSAPAQTIANLIGTARETELARATRDERWLRTTQSTLAELAEAQAETAAIQEEMAAVAGATGAEPETGREALLRAPHREAVGWFLLRCLDELRTVLGKGEEVRSRHVSRCADALRDGTAAGGEPRPQLSPAEVRRMGAALASFIASTASTADAILAEMTSPGTPIDRQLVLFARIHDASTLVITSSRYLIGEIPTVAASSFDPAERLQLRRDLLAVAATVGRSIRITSAMLRVLLVATLLEEEVTKMLPPAAAEARAALAPGLDAGLRSPVLRRMAEQSDRLGRLVALAPRLRALGARANAVAADATQLSASNAPERQLVLSRRFSPLGGGALLNFSGFLDRPLRDLDFYAGVYDAAAQLASHACEIQGPYPAGSRTAPAFRADAPMMLDPSVGETQRCLGGALRGVVEALEIRRSRRALFVLATLSRLEMAANLGSRDVAARILAEPSWSWLGEAALSPGDPIGPALAAVTSRMAPCRESSTEALCLRDPDLDELLDALHEAGYAPSSPSMREALGDRDRWMAQLTRKLVDRAATVSISAPDGPGSSSSVVRTGVGLGELWARRAQTLASAPMFDLDPSTIPPPSAARATLGAIGLAHLLPYRVSLDVVRGGAAFSFLEPALRVRPWFSIESIADIVGVEGSGRLSSTFGLIPTFRWRGVALGGGAEIVLPWNGDAVFAPGPVARLALLQERLAITVGTRSLSRGDRGAIVSLSVSDLNGVAYWLALWAAGRR